MANPSLQIGNENWAIKEDNLLGYSTAGTRFVPQPITMTRASAGTRVNSSGLVETVELLGSELVTNGDFASDLTGWTGYGTTSATGGVATIGASANSGIYQDVLTNGLTYSVTINVTSYDGVGNAQVANNNGNVIYTITTTGIQTFTFTHSIASGNLLIRGLSNALFSLSSVSVKESTKNNLARVDYDGSVSSLLVEPERTNLFPYSEDFTSWTTTGSATVTPNTTISPDGTQNADTLDLLAGDYFYKPITSGAGTFTISCYVKVASGTLDFKMQSFNGTDGADASSVFTANTNWQRFEFTTTVTVDSNFYPVQVSGLVGGDFLIWGSQLEEGSYATSYIPTDGGTVTRVADQYSKTGISNLINSEEGVLFLEIAALSDDLTGRAISLSDGTVNNGVQIYYFGTSNRIRCRVYSGGVLQNTINVIGYTITDSHKIALKWGGSFMSVFVDGAIYGTALAITSSPTALDRLKFDIGQGSSIFFGKAKHLQVYKTALTPTELIALTT